MIYLYNGDGSPEEFQTIQAAINAASSGDTITVDVGSYDEDLTITVENLTIRGANAEISGSGLRGEESAVTGSVFIGASGVVLEGFSITGSDAGNENSNVFVQGDDVVLSNNIIIADENSVTGIVASSGISGLTIDGNAVNGFSTGVYVNPQGTTAAIVTHNTFSGNDDGLVFESGPSVSDVADNTFTGSLTNDIRVALRTSTNVDLSTVVHDNDFSGGDVQSVFVRASGLSNVTGTGFADHIEAATAGIYENIGASVTFDGAGGDDTLIGSVSGDFLTGGAGSDTIFGGDGSDNISTREVGMQEVDTVNAGAGDDIVTAGGSDILDGGAGLDRLDLDFGDGTLDQTPIFMVLSAAGNGFASDGTSITGFETLDLNLTEGDDVTSTGNVAAVVNGRGGDDRIVTGSASDVLNGGDGNDSLDGGAGNDTLLGGSGNNTLVGGAGNDTIFNQEGNDTIRAGAGLDYIYLNGGTNSVDAGVDNDTILSFGGINDILGGTGDDTLFTNLSQSTVRADLGAGNDTVFIDSRLNQDARVAAIVDPAAQYRITFTSSEVGNGTAVDGNTLPGQDGGLAVRLQSEGADDSLTGSVSRFDDEGITFRSGDGATFDVRDISGTQRGDMFSVVALGTNLADTLDFSGEESNQNYYVNGGMGDDVIRGVVGNDFLVGGAGNDTLFGNDGNDTLLGGIGADLMTGGSGNDTYFIDDVGDRVTEGVNAGIDTISSSLSLTLSANVENLILTGTALNGTGNALANTITGNDANNVLNGGTGADQMYGGSGDDNYYVDNANDRVFESTSSGADTIYAATSYTLRAGQAVETIRTGGLGGTEAISLAGNEFSQTVQGNAGVNKLFGYDGNDQLFGYAGADTLSGGQGTDKLYGGIGNDSFAFDTALGAGNIDTIADFVSNSSGNNDTIRLENAIFTALTATGTLAAGLFAANASGVATQADDRIIYETDTGKLFYDSNGSEAGGSVQFATLTDHPTITASDFLVI